MKLLWNKNFWVMLVSDVVLLSTCYVSAYLFRYEGVISPQSASRIKETILPLLVCKITSFFFFDVYRGMWRYTGIMDLLNIIKGSLAGSLFLVLYLTMVYHFSWVSRGIIIADLVFTIVAVGGLRLLIRLYYQKGPDIMDELIFWRRYRDDGKRALIMGTGPLSEQLFRELQGDCRQTFQVVGFIDEGSVNQGMKIHGVPILGALEDIHRILSYYRVDDIFIADPGIGAGKIKALVETCAGLGVRVKVVPSLLERMSGSAARHLRDIRIEDLLEREPVNLDMQSVSEDIRGKDVLITGAGGSIGSELARQIFKFGPGSLILLDNAETPLYSIDMELKGLPSQTNVIPCIGNIKNSKRLDQIFKKYRPHIVFHAAAYKHVPLMELTPLDAVHTNILGTFRLASAACKYRVEKFVMISTDKAVRPTSVMGATKRVAEMIVKAMNGNGTRFVTVRFGNVLGSNGSVVPLFERQIAVGGPVTVTHPEVIRYFMTIPEAVMLVLQASAIGKGGELFLLDMGEPVRIVDLARNMIRLAGLVPDRDVKIEFIGLRPGEKLYEELLTAGEDVVDTAYNKIKICKNFDDIHEERLFEAIERFRLLVESSYDHEAAVRILRSLVPSYTEHVERRDSPMPRPETAVAHHGETAASQDV